MKASIVQAVGLLLCALGAGLIFVPAGVVVAGLATVGWGLAMERNF